MTNVQLYLAFIIPTLLMLLGVIMNRSDNAALRTEMAALASSLRSEVAALRQDMVALRNQVHQDMVMLHERVAVVDSKQDK